MPTKQFIVLFFVYNNHSMWWPVVLNYEDALWKCRSNLWYIGGVGSQSSRTFRRCSPTTCFDGQVLIIWEACPDEIPNIPDRNSVMITIHNFVSASNNSASSDVRRFGSGFWRSLKGTSLCQLTDLNYHTRLTRALSVPCVQRDWGDYEKL